MFVRIRNLHAAKEMWERSNTANTVFCVEVSRSGHFIPEEVRLFHRKILCQSMWPRGAGSDMIFTLHDKGDGCEDVRTWRLRRVLRDVDNIEACRQKKMGSSSTGWGRAPYFDLFRANFSNQSAKHMEGAEWRWYVLCGQIVRGFSARDDAERAGRIAAGK
jgi:hypothetical protein